MQNSPFLCTFEETLKLSGGMITYKNKKPIKLGQSKMTKCGALKKIVLFFFVIYPQHTPSIKTLI